jgi:hypothetical protein
MNNKELEEYLMPKIQSFISGLLSLPCGQERDDRINRFTEHMLCFGNKEEL